MIYICLVWWLFSCSNDMTWVKNEAFQNPQKKEIILALWDSLTAWYWVEEHENYPGQLQKKLDEAWYQYELINAWVSGDTSANVLSRAPLYRDQNPSIVILIVWGNDGLRGLSTLDLQQNILQIIENFPQSKIVLWGMDIPSNLWEPYRNDFKKVYTQIAHQKKEIYFMEFFLEWVAGKMDYNISDMIHPNNQWYKIIVKNLMNFLEKNKIIIK